MQSDPDTVRLEAHPLVRALAGELGAELLAGAPIGAGDLDKSVDPRTSDLVADADADQLAVLDAVRQGRRLLVVEGPPGTGKSQTIANLLAQALARGASALLVSERPAALEVVRRRLEAAGLGSFCAALRGGELDPAGEPPPDPGPTMSEEEHVALEGLRAKLDDYARQLHEVHWPLERSAADVLAELATLHLAPRLAWTPPAADLLTPDQLQELQDLAERLAGVWRTALDDSLPWRRCLEKASDQQSREEWLALLQEAVDTAERLAAASATLARSHGWPPPASPSEISRLLEVDALVRQGPALPRHWLTGLDIEGARIEAEFWKQATDAHRTGLDALRSRFRQGLLDLPDGALQELEAAAARTHALLGREPGTVVERRDALVAWIETTLKWLPEWKRLAGRLASALRLRTFRGSMEGSIRIAQAALMLNRPDRPLWNWLDQNACAKVEAAIAELESFYARYKAARRAVLAAYRESVAALDVDAMIARFEGPWSGALRWLRAGYHRDRRLLRAHRHDGRFPPDALGDLKKIKALELQRSMLEPQRKKYEALLGPYDAGPDTPLAAARRALATARSILALVTDAAELEAFAAVLREGAPSAEIAGLAATFEASLIEGRGLVTRAQGTLPPELIAGEEQELLRLPFGRLGPWIDEVKEAVADLLARYDAVAALRSASGDGPAAFEEVLDALVQLSDLRAFNRRLSESADHLRNVYGGLFAARDTDWAGVLEALDRAEEVRGSFGEQGVPEAFLEVGPRDPAAGADPEACRGLLSRCEALFARIQVRFDHAHSSREHPVDARDPWDVTIASLSALSDRIDERQDWIEYAGVRRTFEEHDLWSLLDELQSRRLPARVLGDAVRRALLEAWWDHLRAEAPGLRDFTRAGHEALVAEFRALDRRHRELGPARVLADAAAHRPASGQPRAVLASPAAVGQLAPEHAFDLVIFDEAAPIAPEDAVPALSRARAAVVFGDPRQLPARGQNSAGSSLLSELMAAGAPVARLRWHYGTSHDSLISFPNAAFYADALVTLPSPLRGAGGIRLERVAEGSEADRVATLVEEHLRERPERSLGVVVAGEAARDAVRRAIERRIHGDPALRPRPPEDPLEGFFVREIDCAQGDVRDVIVLCLPTTPADDARLDARRLNIAVTRARGELILVTSLASAGVDSASEESRLLRGYLERVERGGGRPPAGLAPVTPLREDVAAAVRAMGCSVVQPVGSGAQPLHIGVVHPERPDRFLLGIECDDEAQRAAWPARDRERLRYEALEGLGWSIHRVWSPEWVADREGELQRLREALRKADQRARALAVAPSPAPASREPASISQEREPVSQEPTPVSQQPAQETRPYQPARLQAVSLPAALHDPRCADLLAALLRDVVSAESPVHRELASQRVLAACGVDRRGKRVEKAVDRALRVATERGWIEEQAEFLRVPGAGTVARVRTPAAGDPASRRDGAHIPPDEIRLAAELALRETPGLGRRKLLARVGRTFGLERLAAKARAHFEEALRDVLR